MPDQFIQPSARMTVEHRDAAGLRIPVAPRAEESREILEHEDPVLYSDYVKFSRFGEISPSCVFKSPLGHPEWW
jgi:hypothetical protein